jgi:hypothetical protein
MLVPPPSTLRAAAASAAIPVGEVRAEPIPGWSTYFPGEEYAEFTSHDLLEQCRWVRHNSALLFFCLTFRLCPCSTHAHHTHSSLLSRALSD